jgi:hypothetical protein
MRLEELGLTARSGDADDVSLGDILIPSHTHGAELQERDRVAVRRPDGDRAPTRRHGAGKGDPSAGRRDYRGAHRSSDVDSAMLAPSVRIPAEVERS